MNGRNKVYVIDPVDSKPDSKIGVDISPSLGEDGKELPEYLRSSEDDSHGDSGGGHGNDGQRNRSDDDSDRGTSRVRKKDRQSGVPLILSYIAGPCSILATARGRRSKVWAGLAASSVILSIAVIWMWEKIPYWSMRGTPAGAAMLLAAVAAVISGFSAWTKAVIQAGHYEGPRLRRSPGWIRKPLAAGLLGIIFPGMGLFVTGRARQAAVALWIACATVISVLFLISTEWLWNFNAYAGAFALNPDTLEHILIGIGVMAALGGLAWVVQALNGARLAGRVSSRKTVTRNSWAAVALLISVIAFSAFSRPAVIAEALDEAASAARGRGMRVIPLKLSLAAASLDPSRPGYVIKAIGLYEDIGDQATADLMRRDLIGRLETSVPLLEEAGIVRSKTGAPGDAAVIPAGFDIGTIGAAATTTIPAELLILDWKLNSAGP